MEDTDHDHAYTHTTYDAFNPVEYTYKLSQREVQDFVRLRVSNKFLFSGRRNSCPLAWRTLLKHMGLQQKMTHSQAAKKWENLKRKYKDLKSPPLGVKVFPDKWPHFTLLDDAMTGRLDGSAPVLKAVPHDNTDSLPASSSHKRKQISITASASPALTEDRTEVDVVLNGDNEEEEEEEERARRGSNKDMEDAMHELESERALLESERAMVESERQVLEREKQVLERERVMLEREFAMLDRERASVEREKATLEREKAMMEREKTMLEKDRGAVATDRLSLQRDRSCLERQEKTIEKTAGCEEDKTKDCKTMDRKERFLMLFENLIENF